MRKLARLFKALGNEKRLEILQLLSKKKEMSVEEIADKINLSFKSTSKHLILLEQLDLLERQKKGASVYYQIVSSPTSLAKTLLRLVKK